MLPRRLLKLRAIFGNTDSETLYQVALACPHVSNMVSSLVVGYEPKEVWINTVLVMSETIKSQQKQLVEQQKAMLRPMTYSMLNKLRKQGDKNE
jgi:hypothetical protein